MEYFSSKTKEVALWYNKMEQLKLFCWKEKVKCSICSLPPFMYSQLLHCRPCSMCRWGLGKAQMAERDHTAEVREPGAVLADSQHLVIATLLPVSGGLDYLRAAADRWQWAEPGNIVTHSSDTWFFSFSCSYNWKCKIYPWRSRR